jgi:glycerol dehydrogenase-like iron-containing ADH family enzyme
MTETYVAQALIAPRKYVQGRSLLSSLGKYVEELGKDALVIADEGVWGLVREQVERSFAEAQVRLIEENFGGECSKREIERLRGFAEREGASVVVGVGGGKAMDTAKAVGHVAGVRWASVPTIASTDTPTSALSVIYTDDGVFEEYMLLPRNPDLGTLTQLALEGRPTAEINDFIAFCNRVGLATTLEQVGLGGADRDDLMTVAKAATMPDETIHNMPFAVDAEMVCDAMVAADAYGRAFREAEF